MKKLLLFLSLLPFISYGQEEICTGNDGLCVSNLMPHLIRQMK